MNLLFLFVYYLTKLSTNIYFKSIVVVGKRNVPQKGPVIFAINHPNMAVDSLLTCILHGRMDSHFWAKAPVFIKHPIFGLILKYLGGLPVYRPQDQLKVTDSERKEMASDLFESSYEVLEAGRSIILCPEGFSYTRSHMIRLKTGTARLALAFARRAQAAGCPHAVIVPVGFTYLEKDAFRSELVAEYGKPIDPTHYLNDPDPIHHLTSDLLSAMKACTVNAESWEELQLVETTKQILTTDIAVTLAQSVQLSRRLCCAYQKYKDREDTKQMRRAIQQYHEQLCSAGLCDSFVAQPFTTKTIILTLLLKSSKLGLVLPLMALGYLMHYPLYLMGLLVEATPYVEDITQSKLGYGCILTPILYLGYFYLGWLWRGWPGLLLSSIVVPVTGYLLAKVWAQPKELSTYKMILRMLYIRLTDNTTIDKLVQMRLNIAHQLDKLVSAQELGLDPSVRVKRGPHQSVPTIQTYIDAADFWAEKLARRSQKQQPKPLA